MTAIYYEDGNPAKVLTEPEFVYSDGGRSNYFKANGVSDCVCRAICNATGADYKETYDMINELASKERITKNHKKRSSARDGVSKKTTRAVMEKIGYEWHPVMKIGTGCTMHLCKEELPEGTLIVSVSGHVTCVKDKVLYDTFDCSRGGERCVYGYWMKK